MTLLIAFIFIIWPLLGFAVLLTYEYFEADFTPLDSSSHVRIAWAVLLTPVALYLALYLYFVGDDEYTPGLLLGNLKTLYTGEEEV